jgi:uncharacterized membrane protein YciS (DUF1049 family)
MKWFIIIFIIVIAIAIATDYMGGAKDAAANYNKLLQGKPVTQPKQ